MSHNTHSHQRGFSLIMGIFLVVVLGGIAVFIGRVATMQHQSSALDEEGAMALQAARAGIEWGVYQAIRNGNCTGSTSMTFPTGTDLKKYNYTATVACIRTTAYEGSSPVNFYQITATARNGNSASGNYYVERQLQATVGK